MEIKVNLSKKIQNHINLGNPCPPKRVQVGFSAPHGGIAPPPIAKKAFKFYKFWVGIEGDFETFS
jgi:hypothetical protein